MKQKVFSMLALLLMAATGAVAQTTYTVVGNNEAMFGLAWDPSSTANDMTKNGDGTYSITYTNVYLTEDVQYKVVENHSWTEAYPDENRVINIAKAGTYTVTIHFNPTTHEVYETIPYTVTLADGTDDVENWTITPKMGLSENDQVTITYNGTKKVKSVTAVKKAAVETMEFVEFTSGGKKVKFANMNLGATSVADGTKSYGDYYAWGATEPFGTVDYSTNPAKVTPTEGHTGGYSQANAPYYSVSVSAYTKYNTDNLTTLEAADDVVTAKMGEGYRMPTTADFQTLYAACGGTGESKKPSSISSGDAYSQGIYWVEGAETAVTVGSDKYKANGVLFVQDADTHVFFPAAGFVSGTNLTSAGSYGTQWSSSVKESDTKFASFLFFGNNSVRPATTLNRYYGFTVRPVQEGTLLSTITSDYTAQNGETLYGKLGSNVKISIADGAKVTLKDVTINGVNNPDYGWAGITCAGDATITLEGANTLKGFQRDYPGIYVPEGKTLTIEGEGSLNASGNGYSTGIGGGFYKDCGDIVINGGNITATGGNNNAGIGGGDGGNCGAITISGGTVTATGGDYAAGIGSGQYANCGDITISGGTITATGGYWAAGIGGGYKNGASGNITITSGVTQVTATKGSDDAESIGKGKGGTAITVNIENGANVIQN